MLIKQKEFVIKIFFFFINMLFNEQSQSILDQARADRQAIRAANPGRFQVKPTLAERCLRQPLRRDSNAQDWFIKSFDSRSRSRSAASTTNKSNSLKHRSRHTSAADLPKKSSWSQPNGKIKIFSFFFN